MVVQSAASRKGMREVVKQDGGFRRGKIGLVHPSVFTPRLSLNKPCVMEKAAACDERVEVKAPRSSLDRHPPVHVRRLLFFGRTFVIPEVVEAVASEDGWERKGWRFFERVTVDPQFAAIPETASAGVQQARRPRGPGKG